MSSTARLETPQGGDPQLGPPQVAVRGRKFRRRRRQFVVGGFGRE